MSAPEPTMRDSRDPRMNEAHAEILAMSHAAAESFLNWEEKLAENAPEGTTAPPLSAETIALYRRVYDLDKVIDDEQHTGIEWDSACTIQRLLDEVDSLRSQLASMTPGLSEQEADELIDAFERAAIDDSWAPLHAMGPLSRLRNGARAALRAALVRTKP